MSILFHSITVKRKKEFLKRSSLTLKEGTFLTYLVKYDLLDRNNIEEVYRRLLVKDLIKITTFSIPSSFFERF